VTVSCRKATSVAGDWLYVQPTMDDLPVGVVTVPADLTLIRPKETRSDTAVRRR
jgi:hypothetical protein